ncbi:hypothetical protein B7R25_11685 [Subtercola boreus]|uniref:Sucrase ferredoxin n=1 Tax=Subtercola boreus TaxID=120213 RepID=A0A3E0W963_9MICO|nr:hypothetical protein B7R24_11585 [Subtercola boreus]RFA19750.1 hypothetical protein B7R23_11565 [Subtercola boreus]RFA26116.1 hypothetical protein B7R25_11685 [Subtercola boreus]
MRGEPRLLAIPLSSTRHLGTGSPDWLPCSDRSRERRDPLFATGSRGLQWFLVEIEGSWGANAFTSSALSRQLGQQLVSRIEAAGMRPLAIRRTGRRGAQSVPRWRWAFVDSRPGFEQVRWGEVDAPEQLLDVPLDGSTGIHSAKPIYGVCTHAKHDRCCAVRGRPVVGALAAEFPDETWECSHLGGDRFAGTMVLLPEGLYYGRVDDVDAVDVVDLAREGRVDERFFRGRSSLTHAVQAAQHYARLQFGDDRLAAYAPLGEAPGEGDGVTVVTLAAGCGGAEGGAAAGGAAGGTIEVAVAEILSQPLLSNCGATRFGRVREYALVSLTVT